MISIEEKDCCGCGACVASCNKRAIALKENEEGFLYPFTNNDLCIKCGICEKVCPALNTFAPVLTESVSFACKSKDKNTQLSSASGGVFPLLAKTVINNNGYVFGAGFNDKWHVEHFCISNEVDLLKLCKSKYVQSYAVDSYKNVRDILNQGFLVLYSGTPCQCSALRNFLRKDYENLYIVDIVCHGVPSPKVWDKYLEELSSQYGCKTNDIIEIQFKYKDSKKFFWKHPGFLVKWKDGTQYLDFSNNTPYENSFLTGMNVRSSCYNCKVKNLSSKSDITIGDFWGCEYVQPDFFDNDGISIVFVNTLKGKKLLDKIKSQLDCRQISLNDALKYNKRISQSVNPHHNRTLFFNKIKSLSLLDSYIFAAKKSYFEVLFDFMLNTIRNLKNKYLGSI